MAKTTKNMVRVTVVGYVEQPNLMKMDEVKAFHEKMETLKARAQSDFYEVQKFDTIMVGRLYEVEDTPVVTEAEDTPEPSGDDADEITET